MLDDIDHKILKIVQAKARIPNVDVAREVGMAPSAVRERILKLEKQGYIDGYEVRLNPERFGKSLVAFVTVTPVSSHLAGPVARRLEQIPEIQEIHFISGEDALLVKVRVAHPQELDQLLRKQISPLEGVRATHTRIALNTFKETARIPIAQTGK